MLGSASAVKALYTAVGFAHLLSNSLNRFLLSIFIKSLPLHVFVQLLQIIVQQFSFHKLESLTAFVKTDVQLFGEA